MNSSKLRTSLIILCLTYTMAIWAQVPNQISYQATIRNSSGDLWVNQPIGMRISILQTTEQGASVYIETHQTISNSNGLVSLIIGSGAPTSGNINTINWNLGPYFIKMEADLNGGNNYTISETKQLLSVPYALVSNNTNALNGIPVSSQTPSNNSILTYNGSSWTPIVQSGGTDAINCSSSNTNFTVRGTGSGNYECTDALWITNTGYVGVGTNSPSLFHDLTIGTEGLLVNGTSTTSNIAGRLRIGSISSTTYDLQVDGDSYMNGALRIGTTNTPDAGGVRSNGDIQTAGNFIQGSSTSGSGTVMIRTSSGELRPQSSTIKVKENVQPLKVDKDRIFALKPVSYQLKPQLGGQKEIGLIAEDVELVVPELVVYGPAREWIGNTGLVAKDSNGNEITDPNTMEPYSVFYDRLPVMLLEIIKEQDKRIQELENRLNAISTSSK